MSIPKIIQQLFSFVNKCSSYVSIFWKQANYQTYVLYIILAASPRRRVQSDYMHRRPPVLAPSALGNRPPV